MYHLDGTDILDELYYRKTESICPECLKKLPAVIEEEDGISIITGCGHSGILNMVYTAQDRYPGRPVKAVVGGFHLTDRDTPSDMIHSIGKALKSFGCDRVITGHCTGTRAKEILREELGACFSALCTGYRTEI